MHNCFHYFAVDLVPDNLCKVRNLLWDAMPDWFDLGLELGIKETTLKVIERDNRVTKQCFTDMLSKWLKMVDPHPSWEKLIEALEKPSVGHKDLVKSVKKELGIPMMECEETNGK